MYKVEKKALQKMIEAEKMRRWRELCEGVEEDVWGDGYKIAIKSLKPAGVPYSLSEEKEDDIIEVLFPAGEGPQKQEDGSDDVKDPPPITPEEMEKASAKIKIKKAPGPDGIPAEALREAVRVMPGNILEVYNQLLR